MLYYLFLLVLNNPANANANILLPSVQGGTGVSSPTIHGVLIAQGSSAFSSLVLTAGQILIGTTSSDPSGATLTQGSGITITSVSGSITITNATLPSGGYLPVDVTGTSQSIAAGNAYVAV